MKIELHSITIRELVDGYRDNDEEGVVGYGGRLDIRPKYQREFVYDDKQRNAVIETVRQNFPLNVMYWMKREDGGFEVLDGQQRTVSICRYVDGRGSGIGRFSIDDIYFHNLDETQQKQILDYPLMVYFCEGESEERLKWFETVNIAGAKLTEQELRNAIYSGSWVTDAKRYFSKTGCAAHGMAKDYMNGSPIRQDYLETAIDWLSEGHINGYMAQHQHDDSANELWLYFKRVIDWVEATFPVKRKEMKGVEWGWLYNRYGSQPRSPKELEAEVSRLMQDEDVSNKKGIYKYVFTREEKWLNIRAFSDKMKREAYERQRGFCVRCGEHFDLLGMDADHITPWCEGGATTAENCQMLCRSCNRRKSSK